MPTNQQGYTHAGPSTGMNYLNIPSQTPPYGPTLGMGMNGSVGTRAQAQNRTIPNIRQPRPLSSRFPEIEAQLAKSGFVIQRQQQNPQPTVHPIAPEQGPLYPILPGDTAALPATPPVLEGQIESATARRQQQDPVPPEMAQVQQPANITAEVLQIEQQQDPLPPPKPDAPELEPPQDQQPANIPEAHGLEKPAENIPAGNRGITYHLPNIMSCIRDTLKAVGFWICHITTWIFYHIILRIFKCVWAVLKSIFNWLWAFMKFLLRIRYILIIVVTLVLWYWYQFVAVYVCSSVNAFCEVPCKPFGPIICPVVRCLESPDQDTSGTAALVPYVGDEVNRNTNREDPEYIRSLFQIPCALDSVRVSLEARPLFIEKSNMPDREKATLTTTLERIILELKTMRSRTKQFNIDYIDAIRTIRENIGLFKSFFTKTIDDHTGAETASATTILQFQFEEYVSSSIAPLRSLFSSAVEIQSDLSQLQQRLTAFYEHAADAAQSVHSRNEEKDKTDTGGDLRFSLAGSFWRTKDKFSWIDGDTQLLKMHKGDLIDVLTVFGGANSRISEVEKAIGQPGDGLRTLTIKDIYDGRESARVMTFTRELSDFIGWMMDEGEEDLEKLEKDVKEEKEKNSEMIKQRS